MNDFCRDEYGRVLASVIRLVRDFDIAEEAVQEAFEALLPLWNQSEGRDRPANPRAWMISTARYKAIDVMRRRGRLSEILREMHEAGDSVSADREPAFEEIPDERLRLIFTCCHPALAREAQVALALRTLCGLSTDDIARAFLTQPSTIAQRLVRAKKRIRTARIPYEIPTREQLPDRIEATLAVVYLVFSEGFAATAGDYFVRADLCREAIRLGRMLGQLLPDDPAPIALLALMLLHDARRAGRTTAAGEMIPLEEQDRSVWDREQIAEGLRLAQRAMQAPAPGSYALQAAIAAEHAKASVAADTDCPAIAAHYRRLVELQPSPIVELNRAVAVAMAEGFEVGLKIVEVLKRGGTLDNYYLRWGVEADLHRRLGNHQPAAAAYRRALELVRTETERRFLERRLAEVVESRTRV